MLELALVGAGIMGGHHARIAAADPSVRVSVVVDPDEAKGKTLAAYLGAEYAPGIGDPGRLADKASAAIITSPSELHAEQGVALMAAGLDVLVEKPMATTPADAERLLTQADRTGRILMVGHVERFNAAVRELHRLTDDLIHLDVRRVGPYTPRVSCDVVLDMMIHDADLVRWLVGREVVAVQAVTREVRSGTADLATALLTFDGGVTAALTASRISQSKQRQIELVQADNVVVADLLRQQVTVHRVEHAEFVGVHGARYQQRGLIEIPYLEHLGEPLAVEQRHFVECVRERRQPEVTGRDGLAALELALRIRDQAIAHTAAPRG